MTVEHRGTSNTNDRGSAASRRARRAYLMEAYRADVDLARITWPSTGDVTYHAWSDRLPALADPGTLERVPAVRCYRCGCLLAEPEMEVDRIKPGCEGGTYARTNIRPVCPPCNKITGMQAKARKAARVKR